MDLSTNANFLFSRIHQITTFLQNAAFHDRGKEGVDTLVIPTTVAKTGKILHDRCRREVSRCVFFHDGGKLLWQSLEIQANEKWNRPQYGPCIL